MSSEALKQVCKLPQLSLTVFSNNIAFISSLNFYARVKMVGIENKVCSNTTDTFVSVKIFLRNSVKCAR